MPWGAFAFAPWDVNFQLPKPAVPREGWPVARISIERLSGDSHAKLCRCQRKTRSNETLKISLGESWTSYEKMPSKTPTTTSDAARIQSAEARAGNGGVNSGSFAARAQAAAARNENTGKGK